MPPTFDQDDNGTSKGTSQNSKTTLKSFSAGVQAPAKNGRKNGAAKDTAGGGIMAAVTKNAAKINSTKHSTPSSKIQSPAMKPAASPLNGIPSSSPSLDALSSASIAQTTSPSTSEWAQNVPAFSGSPSNLINLGESPPTQPSSYDDKLSGLGWTIREQRGAPHSHPQSASPPTRRRPLSYQMDSHFLASDDNSSQMSYGPRRFSAYSHQSQNRYAAQPPLPHHTQAHFYGAPDPTIMLSPRGPGLAPGSKGYYCGLDNLPRPASDLSTLPDTAIVTGYEGGLNIYSVSKGGLNKVTSIEGLRGGVYHCKILPWTIPTERSNGFPLIAAVVHGPVWTNEESLSGEFHSSPPEVASDSPESARGSPRAAGPVTSGNEYIEFYQTTVEVYSLASQKHVATLLSVPKIPLSVPPTNPLFKAPSPTGGLSIRADGGNIVVSSGVTGETWIFQEEPAMSSQLAFRCIGKTWTSVQQGLTVDASSSNDLPDGDWQSGEAPAGRHSFQAPILSLSGRWLAYSPPAPSSQISLRAIVPNHPSTTRTPGLNTYAPPQIPQVNCGVDTPGGESMFKHLAQVATQEVIKGAAWMGKQGWQAWNNYMNKPSSSQPGVPGVPPQPYPSMGQQFPPTHGLSNQTAVINRDPALISILDLRSLAQHSSLGSTSLHPLTTFKIPHGCSFLSFSPSGLALFTASSKGDVQFVWDLMRLQYAKSSFLKTNIPGSGLQGPHVRQVAQFSRMTIARVVDVVWTSPHGERAAMVTEPGTVHILDLPASAFTWPPPRRKVAPPRPSESSSETASLAASAAGVASSAVNSLWTATRPLVSRQRRSSAGISSMSAASVTSQAGHGTQALAAGISRSVGAATGKVNEMRKAGGTKLHLPRSTYMPSTACVRLLNGKRNDSVFLIGGGMVRIYTVNSRKADRPADKQKASRGAKHIEFKLPLLPDFKITPEVMHESVEEDRLDLDEGELEDPRWKARQSTALPAHSAGTESSIPQAEIDSNAPYQPFHTDRRVGLHVYSTDEASLPSPSVSALFAPQDIEGESSFNPKVKSKGAWAFGGTVKSVKLDVGPAQVEDDSDATMDHRALPSSAMERVMKIAESSEDMEQIVVTTRRRKGVTRSADGSPDVDEEGFFEDDCEVLDFASQRV